MPYEGKVGKIIIAFSGCGKTYFCKHNLNWMDIDYYVFYAFYNDVKYSNNLNTITNWYNYNVFLNAPIHLKASTKVDYVIIPLKTMKEEIIKRVKERDINQPLESGWTNGWIMRLEREWNNLWDRFNALPYPKIYLKPGQYISDVIDEYGNLKKDVEIVY